MIDIHCHILPGIDDGPDTAEAALKMARIAAKDGIKTIVATPHCFDGIYDCQQYDITGICSKFNHFLIEQKVPLTVVPGAEVHLVPELIEFYRKGYLPSFAGSSKTLLLELPEIFMPDGALSVIKELRDDGVRCILAHPERYVSLMRSSNFLKELIFLGVELQLTSGSLTGDFGRSIQEFTKDLLKGPGQFFIASDGHNTSRRQPKLAAAAKMAAKIVGQANSRAMVSFDHSEFIINSTFAIN